MINRARKRAAKRGAIRSVGSAALLIALSVPLVTAAGASPDSKSYAAQTRTASAPVWPLDLRAATARQDGLNLVLAVRSSGTISASSIAASGGRSLCFDLFKSTGPTAVKRLCLGLSSGKPRMVLEKLNGAGLATGRTVLKSAIIARPSANRLIATVSAHSVGIGLGSFRWQAASAWVDRTGCPDPGCSDRTPAIPATVRYAALTPVGCEASGASVRTNGSRARRIVGLSFDDGPSKFTPAVLDLLKRYNAHATFFQVGNQMSGRAAVQKRILAEGNGLGDHSWSHPVLSGGGSFASSEVARTKRRITAQTGFTPCLFRAPYGAISSSLVGIVRSQKMLTVQWDVDPADWARPGASVIASRVLRQVRPGSIILMHEGGGDRSQSVAATATILPSLRRRGYQVVSVEKLLGLKLKYG